MRSKSSPAPTSASRISSRKSRRSINCSNARTDHAAEKDRGGRGVQAIRLEPRREPGCVQSAAAAADAAGTGGGEAMSDAIPIDANGHFAGYASVFGKLDEGGDVVMPGAFRASLSLRGKHRIK